MSPFDGNGYRKRVLAPLAGAGSAELTDVFALFDLDPAVDDDRLIEERIRDVVAFWQRERNSPKYRGLVGQLLGRREEMTGVLRDPALRAQRRALLESDRTRAGAERFGRLDAMIAQLVARSGGVPRSKLPALRAAAQRSGLTDAEYDGRLATVAVVDDAAGTGAEPLAPALRRQIRALLDEFGRLSGRPAPRTLLDFLGVAPDAPAGSLEARREAIATRNRQRRHDRERTVVDELLANCATHLGDGDRARYLATVAEEVKEQLRGDVESAVLLDDRLTPAEFERLVREAVSSGLTATAARTVVTDLARDCGGAVETGAAVDYVVCPQCTLAEVAGAREACRRCGTGLYSTCPRCAAVGEASAATCFSCGLDRRGLLEAEADLELAREAFAAGALGEARFRLEAVLPWADHLPGARDLQAAVERSVAAATEQWRSAQRALVEGRAQKALDLLDALAAGGREVAGAAAHFDAAREQAALAVAATNAEVEAALALDSAREREMALLGIAVRAPDHRAAIAALRDIPLAAPSRVSAVVRAGAVNVAWRASPSPGDVDYRVVRTTAGAGAGAGVGDSSNTGGERTLGVTRRCEMEDTPPTGSLVSYQVNAVRHGVMSGAVRTAEVLVAREVGVLTAQAGVGVVELAWDFPDHVAVLWVERTPEPAGTEPARRQRVGGSGWRDRDVVNGRTYRYRVFVEYQDGRGGTFRTSGREVAATPEKAPVPVAGLQAETTGDRVRLTWPLVDQGTVEVYRSAEAPGHPAGTLVDVRGRQALGQLLPADGLGAAVDTGGTGARWYTPVTVGRVLAAVGPTLRHLGVAEVVGLEALTEGGEVVLRWAWPQGCTEALVLWRRDSEPAAGPGDPVAQRAKVTNMKYELGGGWRLSLASGPGGVPRSEDLAPYHFAVVPGVRIDHELVWADTPGPGARATHPGASPRLEYRLEQKGFRRRTLRITILPGNPPPPDLPELVVVARTGDRPPGSASDGTEVLRFARSGPLNPSGRTLEAPLADVRLPAVAGLFADDPAGAAVEIIDPPQDRRLLS